MKSLTEIDLDEGWELIPDEGFLEIHQDGGGNNIYSRKYSRGSSHNSMIQRNYFMCPQEEESSIQFVDKTIPKSRDHELVKRESVKIPVEIKIIPPLPQVSEVCKLPDQDPVSQVFFKKMENEFVEMKVESPRFSIASEGSELAIKNDYGMDIDMRGSDEGGVNIWKKGLTGIGAICSFGMAAATVCVIILSSSQKNKLSQHKLQFQIYSTSDKRIKQVISASRGLQINKARITVGGRYDGDC